MDPNPQATSPEYKPTDLSFSLLRERNQQPSMAITNATCTHLYSPQFSQLPHSPYVINPLNLHPHLSNSLPPSTTGETRAVETETVAAHDGFSRTSSLPVETEGKWRKRKEMQSLRRRDQRGQYVAAMNKVGSSVAPPFGLPSWGAAARQAILGGGGNEVSMGREEEYNKF